MLPLSHQPSYAIEVLRHFCISTVSRAVQKRTAYDSRNALKDSVDMAMRQHMLLRDLPDTFFFKNSHQPFLKTDHATWRYAEAIYINACRAYHVGDGEKPPSPEEANTQCTWNRDGDFSDQDELMCGRRSSIAGLCRLLCEVGDLIAYRPFPVAVNVTCYRQTQMRHTRAIVDFILSVQSKRRCHRATH